MATEYAIVDRDAFSPQYERRYNSIQDAMSNADAGNYLVAIEDGVIRELEGQEVSEYERLLPAPVLPTAYTTFSD